MKIIQLKTEISNKHGVQLASEIEKFIKQKKKVFTNGLGNKRPVFLNKYLPSTKKRTNRTKRRQCFLPALELLRKVRKKHLIKNFKEPTGEDAFDFRGITPSGDLVGVHIREEIEKKDKKLYLISTFTKY